MLTPAGQRAGPVQGSPSSGDERACLEHWLIHLEAELTFVPASSPMPVVSCSGEQPFGDAVFFYLGLKFVFHSKPGYVILGCALALKCTLVAVRLVLLIFLAYG